MIEIKSETFETEEKEDNEETNLEDNGKEEEEEKEEMNNNDIGENIEVKEEDERDGIEDDDDGGEGGGGMSPMETATLLLLSRIAMFNKKVWNGGGEDAAPCSLPSMPGPGFATWMALMADQLGQENPLRNPFLWSSSFPKLSPLQSGADGRLLEGDGGLSGLYSGHHAPRPESSSSASPPSAGHAHFSGFPPHTGGMLVVPQPINASKMGGMGDGSLGLHPHHHLNGVPRKYQCKMCPQVFASKADLQLHTQVHMREPKPYKCSQCSKSFANSSYLSQHMRIHLGIKPYRCEICQRKFTQLSHLQQHIRTHTGDKPYKCRIPGCTKAFSQLSNLQSHSRCHQTDKPYKCNSCYKCFADEQALFEHIPKHKESKHIKTHICSYCGKSYTQETYLAKHMQKHADRTDKRPPIIAGPVSGLQQDLYWPKMDPGLYQSHDRLDPYGQGLMDPSRFHPQFAEDLRQQGYGMGGGGWGDPSKASSAFSPINGGVLPSSTGFNMAGGARGYPFYDPISFQRQSQVGFESKTAGSNLISLSQIKNYAHDRGGPTSS